MPILSSWPLAAMQADQTVLQEWHIEGDQINIDPSPLRFYAECLFCDKTGSAQCRRLRSTFMGAT